MAGAYDTLDVGQLSPRSGHYSDAHKVTPIFQELELGLQSVVDPYARADIFISFGPDAVDVEEAYLSTLSLPAGFQVRAGKFFSPFGRLNQQHPHVWDFVDAPLAMGLAIPASARALGALPVFASLTIPASAVLLVCGRLRGAFVAATLAGMFAAAAGYVLSWVWQIPTGATMVTLAGLLVIPGVLMRRG